MLLIGVTLKPTSIAYHYVDMRLSELKAAAKRFKSYKGHYVFKFQNYREDMTLFGHLLVIKKKEINLIKFCRLRDLYENSLWRNIYCTFYSQHVQIFLPPDGKSKNHRLHFVTTTFTEREIYCRKIECKNCPHPGYVFQQVNCPPAPRQHRYFNRYVGNSYKKLEYWGFSVNFKLDMFRKKKKL